MKKINSHHARVVTLILLSSLLVFFQNCKEGFKSIESSIGEAIEQNDNNQTANNEIDEGEDSTDEAPPTGPVAGPPDAPIEENVEDIPEDSNQAPTLTRPDDFTMDIGETRNVQLMATDPEGGPLTYGITEDVAPAWVDLNSETGMIVVAPDSTAVAGREYTVRINAMDDGGLADFRRFVVTIAGADEMPNDPPAEEPDPDPAPMPEPGGSMPPVTGGGNGAGPGGPLILVRNFEDGQMNFGPGAGNIRPSGNAPTVSQDFARFGNYSMKTVLNRLESPVKFRTEITTNWKPQFDQNTWYGVSIMLPDSYIDSPVWEIPLQWHDIPRMPTAEEAAQGFTQWGHCGRQNPPMAMETKNGRWAFWNIWDVDRTVCAEERSDRFQIDGRDAADFGPIERGVWVDWVFQIRWSYRSTGLVRIWKNGEMVYERTGPNTYHDDEAPYIKMGLYKGWKINPETINDTVVERVLYHDEFRIGGPSATYQDVAPPNN